MLLPDTKPPSASINIGAMCVDELTTLDIEGSFDERVATKARHHETRKLFFVFTCLRGLRQSMLARDVLSTHGLFELADVDLLHPKHRFHGALRRRRLVILQQLRQDGGKDLP
jgi:hypothetical protein